MSDSNSAATVGTGDGEPSESIWYTCAVIIGYLVGFVALLVAGPVGGLAAAVIAAVTDGFSPEAYDAGNRAAFFGLFVIMTLVFWGLSVAVVIVTANKWKRPIISLAAGLTPAALMVAAAIITTLISPPISPG